MKQLFLEDLLHLLHYASVNLSNHREAINMLNVFPVPDGDTGSNMSTTFTGAYEQLVASEVGSITELGKKFSQAMLMNARGNSGVILSQIFRGFGEYLQEYQVITLTPRVFSEALQRGSEAAYQAVTKPTEGTMLTVIREVSSRLLVSLTEDDDFVHCFQVLVEEATLAVERTPSLLPVLQEAGVVDSGAQGLLVIFEGFLRAVRQEPLELVPVVASQALRDYHTEEEYGYCTENILLVDDVDAFNLETLRMSLDSLGSSVVVAQDSNIVKVHVHALRPGDILNLCQQYGSLSNLKIENMELQHQDLTKSRSGIAIVAVVASSGLKTFFQSIGIDNFVDSSPLCNPSTEDFVKAIRDTRAKQVFLLPNDHNIILTAKAATELVEGVQVSLIPTENIAQGIAACWNFNNQCTFEENHQQMLESLSSVDYGAISIAVRDSVFHGIQIQDQDYLALQGKTIIRSEPQLLPVFSALVDSMLTSDYEILYLFWGKDFPEFQQQQLATLVSERFPEIEVRTHLGDQEIYQVLLVAI